MQFEVVTETINVPAAFTGACISKYLRLFEDGSVISDRTGNEGGDDPGRCDKELPVNINM